MISQNLDKLEIDHLITCIIDSGTTHSILKDRNSSKALRLLVALSLQSRAQAK
jgi:hypothetical protein